MTTNEKALGDVPGFTCPVCGAVLKLRVEDFLSEHEARCPKCGTVFLMDGAKPVDQPRDLR